METKTNLTAAQVALLVKIDQSPRMSSSGMHTGTRNALSSRGLIKMVDRFPSGTCLFSITAKGRQALRSEGGA